MESRAIWRYFLILDLWLFSSSPKKLLAFPADSLGECFRTALMQFRPASAVCHDTNHRDEVAVSDAADPVDTATDAADTAWLMPAVLMLFKAAEGDRPNDVVSVSAAGLRPHEVC